MKSFNGKNKTKDYFLGWYFKHQIGNEVISFIPGMCIDNLGVKTAFLQVVTNKKAWYIEYPYDSFFADEKRCNVYIGNSFFSDNGCEIDIDEDDLYVSGEIKYIETSKIKYNIMGPFALLKNMECNHGVISMKHNVFGEIVFNDNKICLDYAIGYIEKDWGTSFPSSYTWLQCNEFVADNSCSFMVSIAKISFNGKEFLGLIGILNINGKEHRFASYNGGKVVLNSENKIIITGGKYRVEAVVKSFTGHELKAPNTGKMNRIIKESLSADVCLAVYKSGKKIFSSNGKNAGFEFVK